MLLICSIESEVEVTHEEIYICHGVRLNHFPFTEQANVFQDALRHRQTLIHSILTGFKMTVDKAENCIVKCELNHHTTFPSIT